MSKKKIIFVFVLVATGLLFNCSADKVIGQAQYCYAQLPGIGILCQKIGDDIMTEEVCLSEVKGEIVDSCPIPSSSSKRSSSSSDSSDYCYAQLPGGIFCAKLDNVLTEEMCRSAPLNGEIVKSCPISSSSSNN